MSCLNNATLYEALFASDLQPSQHPDTDDVRAAIMHTILALGVQECTARMAQEFGDHPDAAIVRMQWARDAVLQASRDSDHDRSARVGAGLSR
jgi:hypothetical protein